MGVESGAFQADLGDAKAQDIDNMRVCDTACGERRVGVVSIDQGFGVSTVFWEI